MEDPHRQHTAHLPAHASVTPQGYESLYFRLVLQGMGVDPRHFRFWKFARDQGRRVKVWVFGRGSAAHYDVPESESWTSLFAHDLKAGTFSAGARAPLNREGLAALRKIVNELATSGLPAALTMLNARVPHRFTGVYRLAGGVMRSVALVDKEKTVDCFSLEPVALEDSFCKFVLKEGHFVTAQSGSDPRLRGHPFAGIVRSYVGVPISGGDTGLVGTLCHFDSIDHPVDDHEFFLVQRFAEHVSAYLENAAG